MLELRFDDHSCQWWHDADDIEYWFWTHELTPKSEDVIHLPDGTKLTLCGWSNPCKHFDEGIGCTVWCDKGDTDCCALCCRRDICGDSICPKAKKLLKRGPI
jgi:hypothetical protein